VVALTKAACPIAQIRVTNFSLGREYTECEKWRARTVHRIRNLHPDIVVVSQSDSVIGTQTDNGAWGDATVRTVNQLQASGLPVAYVLDTPMPDRDVPECVATHLDNVGACNFGRDRSTLYAGRMRAVQEALTASHVTTIDPTRWLCTSTTCPAVVGNILVYRDATHMSATYSRWLAPMTRPLFVARGDSS
jgi:hypothetical protein